MRPPTLLTLAHRLIRDEKLFSRGDVVLCACSGGPDSSALMHALALLRKRLRHELVAVGIDHGLRPEARQELAQCRDLAAELDVPFQVTRVDVMAGGNLQERARIARHTALQEAAEKCSASVIALGHTADDRAETVLMRMLRGSGPRGLAAMPPRGDQMGATLLVRPILRARRGDVMAHIRRHNVSFAADPSNDDLRYLRVRVRRQLIPLLEELSPRIVEHLCDLAEMLERERAADDPLAGLGREQRKALGKALRARCGTTVRVSGSYDLIVTFAKVVACTRDTI